MRAANNVKQPLAGQNIGKSGLVKSRQAGVHPRLEAIVRKHLETYWTQPLHAPTADSWHQLEQRNALAPGQVFILDSGCGTGESTRRLAGRFPTHMVIGVDRSLKRLAKSGAGSTLFCRDNYILLRAELASFWRLLLLSGRSPELHFLLYPNPWPKPGHLSRRWHGHPVFPVLLALGGEIEMRCNWEVYAGEFARAAGLATRAVINVEKIVPDKGISPFEQKYRERGHQLYAVRIPAQFTRVFRHSRLNQ